MKRIFFILICLIMLLEAQAQKPEPVYSFAKVQKPLSWHKEQKAAWKKALEQNPKDALGWYYYYYAHRNLMFNDTTDTRTAKEKMAEINTLVADMEKHVPNSYEYNVVKYMAGGFDMSLMPYLNKAVELGEGRREHLDFMVNMGEIERDILKRDKYCLKKHEMGDISTGMMYYNYNVMTGLAANAILITTGDNDTYPAWALQAQGVRKDITVVNLSLVEIKEYRARLFKELGIAQWNPDSGKAAHESFQKGVIRHIAANKKNYPVYVALTAAGCNKYIAPVAENLYLTGLAYQYSTGPIDNMAVMKRNFEQLYALDYLDRAFYHDLSAALVGVINTNYIVPMLKLFDHYTASGDVQKADWIKRKLLAIVKDKPEEQQVKEHLAQR